MHKLFSDSLLPSIIFKTKIENTKNTTGGTLKSEKKRNKITAEKKHHPIPEKMQGAQERCLNEIHS